MGEPLSLSVIVPATNSPACLPRCVAAVEGAAEAPRELMVIGKEAWSPASARNTGARRATGDILVFVDSDVEVHRDALTRIRTAFERDDDLAGIFGSYDDEPSEPGAVSGFRNLLHHHVHQGSPGPIGSFWAGLGAIRRDTFEQAGGFAEHPIEDIELGLRLAARGDRVVLDPAIQGKHLKRWTLRSMIRTDFLVRGVPWVGLLLGNRGSAGVLNLSWRHRLSALASVAVIAGAALLNLLVVAAAVAALVALNHSFYGLILRRRGPFQAVLGVALHVVHHLVAACSLPAGVALHVGRRSVLRRRERELRVPVGKPALAPGQVAVLGLEHPQGNHSPQT